MMTTIKSRAAKKRNLNPRSVVEKYVYIIRGVRERETIDDEKREVNEWK